MAKRQTIGDNPLDSLIKPITSHDGHPVNTHKSTLKPLIESRSK